MLTNLLLGVILLVVLIAIIIVAGLFLKLQETLEKQVTRNAQLIVEKVKNAQADLWTKYLDYTWFGIGESLVGGGNEIAHIDLLIGKKGSAAAIAFANGLASQSKGHTNLLAVITANLRTTPGGVMITKVTMKNDRQIMQMFGPAQSAVAQAIRDAVEAGTIPQDEADDYVIVIGVFIHKDAGTFPDLDAQIADAKTKAEGKDAGSPEQEELNRLEELLQKVVAVSNSRIFHYNYDATLEAIGRAMSDSPSVAEMMDGEVAHPFLGFDQDTDYSVEKLPSDDGFDYGTPIVAEAEKSDGAVSDGAQQ